MEDEIKRHRLLAVQRFRNGESPDSICTSLGKVETSGCTSGSKRYSENEDSWCEDRSRRPLSAPMHTPTEIEEIAKMVRLNLYNQELVLRGSSHSLGDGRAWGSAAAFHQNH